MDPFSLLASPVESHMIPGRTAEASGSGAWANNAYPECRLVSTGDERADGHDEHRRRCKLQVVTYLRGRADRSGAVRVPNICKSARAARARKK